MEARTSVRSPAVGSPPRLATFLSRRNSWAGGDASRRETFDGRQPSVLDQPLHLFDHLERDLDLASGSLSPRRISGSTTASSCSRAKSARGTRGGFASFSSLVAAHVQAKQAAFDATQPTPPSVLFWAAERRTLQQRYGHLWSH